MYGRMRDLGSMKSFLWSAPELCRARTRFLSNLSPLRVRLGVASEAEGLMDATSFVQWYSRWLCPHSTHWSNWNLHAHEGGLECPWSKPLAWQTRSWDPGKVNCPPRTVQSFPHFRVKTYCPCHCTMTAFFLLKEVSSFVALFPYHFDENHTEMK